MLKIESSLDWTSVKEEVRRLGKMLPAFSNDFFKITRNLENLNRELGNLEVEARRTKSRSAKQACELKVKQINEELAMIQKIHLMGLLSK